MALNLKEIKRHAKEYVEMEAATKVLGVRFEKRYKLFGREDVVLEVHTTDKNDPDWWVICGSTPMNLYSAKTFPQSDTAYSLHQGIMLRMADRDEEESDREPEEIGYDVFISHASEDKKRIVKPLAEALRNRGFRVWYDEFELRVGDSLRQAIDRGLLNSRFGIVVLSPAFFSKNWPQYELNGLAAREVEGHKVILPVWHKLEKDDVLAYSPSLADKVALSTRRMSISKIAWHLGKVLNSD